MNANEMNNNEGENNMNTDWNAQYERMHKESFEKSAQGWERVGNLVQATFLETGKRIAVTETKCTLQSIEVGWRRYEDDGKYDHKDCVKLHCYSEEGHFDIYDHGMDTDDFVEEDYSEDWNAMNEFEEENGHHCTYHMYLSNERNVETLERVLKSYIGQI